MTELGAELLAKASESFANRIASDRKLKRILAKIRDGTSYFDANDYSVRIGELLSEALNTSTENLAFLSEEVARELLEPLLTQDHDLIADVINTIQGNMNRENGVGLNPLIPEVDTDRIDRFIQKVASGEKLDDVRWMFGEPIINYSQSIVDEGIEKNAKATSKIGLKAYIIREAEPSGIGTNTRKIGKKTYTYKYPIPCRWCTNLAGKYEYGTESKEVYQRHKFCRCKVTYVNGNNQQDVWSKVEWTADQTSERERLIGEATERREAERRAEEARKQRRRENVAYVAAKLGYSDRGASIWMNQNKKYIERNGLDYMIDMQRNQDLLRRKSR